MSDHSGNPTTPDDQDDSDAAWDEIEELASRVFDVWVFQPELRWARKAWKMLAKAGLANYGPEVERYRVIFRLLALGGIYKDFCQLAWMEPSYLNYGYWAENEDFDPFVIGRMYQQAFAKEKIDDELTSYNAIAYLAEEERSVVLNALLQAYGNAGHLHADLWLSVEDFDGEEDDDDVPENLPLDFSISLAGLETFSWITSGCYQIGDIE